MPLETATYINDLVTTNPAASDGMNNADDHMRLIKASSKNTFPGATGPLTTTAGGHQSLTSGGPSAPAFTFIQEPTLGIYRSAAGVMQVAGGELRGAVPVGSVHMFLVEPPGVGTDWLELSGGSYSATAFPRLAAALGVSTTIVLPNMKDNGRFPRSRTYATAAGTAEANTVGPHTHPDVTVNTGTESVDHTHAFSGTTGGMNANTSHSHSFSPASVVAGSSSGSGGVGGGGVFGISAAASVGSTNTDHGHAFSGNTGARSTPHSHAVTVPTPALVATENRPEAMSFIFLIRAT